MSLSSTHPTMLTTILSLNLLLSTSIAGRTMGWERLQSGSYDPCQTNPDVKYMCEACAKAGFDFRVNSDSCCHDPTATAMCDDCLSDPAFCYTEFSPWEVEPSKSEDVLTYQNSEMDTTFDIDRPEPQFSERATNLKGSLDISRPIMRTPYFARDYLKPGEQRSRSDQGSRVSKRWQPRYQSILSLYPQRLSYGHSLFLQSQRAHAPARYRPHRVILAKIKRSGGLEEDMNRRINLQMSQLLENLASGSARKYIPRFRRKREIGMGRNLRPSLDFLQAYDNSRLNNYNGMVSPSEIGTSREIEKPLRVPVSGSRGHPPRYSESQASTFRRWKSENMEVETGYLPPASLPDISQDLLIKLPWKEQLGDLITLPADIRRDQTRSHDFFVRLLIFVNALKQAAREHFEGLDAMPRNYSATEPMNKRDRNTPDGMLKITDDTPQTEVERDEPRVAEISINREDYKDAQMVKPDPVSSRVTYTTEESADHNENFYNEEANDYDSDESDDIDTDDDSWDIESKIPMTLDKNRKVAPELAQISNDLQYPKMMGGKFVRKRWGTLGAGKFKNWWAGTE